MVDIIDIASKVLSGSRQRLEAVSQNVANISTPGFKAHSSFADVVSDLAKTPDASGQTATGKSDASRITDFSQAAFSETGLPLDLAIAGQGFFKVSAADGEYLTRQGQFQISSDGRLQTSRGFDVQSSNGARVVLPSGNVEILEDGTVLSDGLPITQIGLFEVDDVSALQPMGGSMFKIDPDADLRPSSAYVHQGMLENSNVVVADEMLSMMDAVREAETGARLVQVYDSLMGQAISTFSQKG